MKRLFTDKINFILNFRLHDDHDHRVITFQHIKDIQTLLPIARPKPHGTAPASMSPTNGLRSFFTLIEEY